MNEKSLTTVIVLALLVLGGVLAWRKGIFARILGGITPPVRQAQDPPQGFAGGLGPKEYGPGGDNRSTFNKLCTTTTQTAGTIGMASGDPRLMAGGVLATAGGPMLCAGYEWAGRTAYAGGKAAVGGVKNLFTSAGRSIGDFVGGLF